MFTVSLVTYHHHLADIRQVVDAVLNSSCTCFYIVDHSRTSLLGTQLSAVRDGRVRYIFSKNRGYGAGHNIAIREAVNGGASYHIVLNPDVSFLPGTLEKIISYMENTPEVGLVMPKTLSQEGEILYNCKLVPSPLDLICKRFLPSRMKEKRMHHFMMKDFDYNRILDVPYLCGCFMTLRCSILEKTGLFDERFFMYPEDIDITRRIFSAGYRTVYYPEAAIVHRHTQGSYHNFYLFMVHIVNMIRYFNKWGWINDAGRVAINQKVLELNREKRISAEH